MLKLLFKATAYYVIWKKFKKQIALILCSIILIGLIITIHDDIYNILKVTNKESIGLLLFFKWFFILLIVGFNIHALRKTNIDSNEDESTEIFKFSQPVYSEKEKKVLNKKKIYSRTDLILNKYEDKK